MFPKVLHPDFYTKVSSLDRNLEIKEVLNGFPYHRIFLKRGQVVYYERTRPMGIYFIREGKVKISRILPLKKEKMVGILKEEEFMGIKEFLNKEPYKYTATAIEDTVIGFISELILAKDTEVVKQLNQVINHSN